MGQNLPNITQLVPHGAGFKNTHLWLLHFYSFQHTLLGSCYKPQTCEDHVETVHGPPALRSSQEQRTRLKQCCTDEQDTKGRCVLTGNEHHLNRRWIFNPHRIKADRSRSVHGVLQARILEWVAMPFSRDLPDPETEPGSPALQADSLLS